MAPAPCGYCGEPAISYRAHLLNLSPTRTCDACGGTVRKRGFWTVLGTAVLLGMAVGYAVFSTVDDGGGRSWLGPAALAALFLVLADYLAWRWLPWEPGEEEAVGEDRRVEAAERSENT